MTRLSRRHFLQFAGSTLASLGLSQWESIHKGNRYAKVLAQDTPRKLALLVGINQYPNSDRFGNLAGCVTDVDLQQYLLIHRFGFNPDDIVRLTTNDGGQNSGKVELVSRDGLWGEAKLVERGGVRALQPGMLLQEYSRVIKNMARKNLVVLRRGCALRLNCHFTILCVVC